jgi:hypothetical protein
MVVILWYRWTIFRLVALFVFGEKKKNRFSETTPKYQINIQTNKLYNTNWYNALNQLSKLFNFDGHW